jgi:UDP-N-acetyl-2-amino-2-deoxyglucuronate dehydrogenase
LNIGIIGCGFIAAKHLQALIKDSTFKLRAVSDVVPERMQQFIESYQNETKQSDSSIAAYDSYQTLLKDPDVEVVVITTISGLHGQMAKEALQHGKHVIVEKPMALSIADAREMIQLADQSQRKLAVCHQKRFYPHLQTIQALVRNGAIGRIVFANVTLCYNRDDAYYKAARWRGTWEMDGGVLLNQSIHNIDLLLWMLSEPVSIFAQIERMMRPIEAEDTAILILQTNDGAIAQIEATVCADRSSTYERLQLIGSDGSISLSGKYFETIETWHVHGVEKPAIVTVDPFEQLYKDFYKAVQEDRDPFISGRVGFAPLETILAAYQSAMTQGVVYFPIQDFSTRDMIRFPFPSESL